MIRAKKHLGQHFLRDENIARNITEYLDPACPLVLEVGPGMGVLTKYITARPEFNAWFMDVDRESVDYLKQSYPQISERVIHADFLDFNLDEFPATGDKKEPFTIIGNFPYNISSQILFKALEARNRVPLVVGMFQKEVAERIAAPPGNKQYGIISVLLQAFYDIDYLFTVSEHVFYPPPKVKSAVIRLRRNSTDRLACDEKLFVRMVKTAFNQRRKTLRNALKPLAGAEKLANDPLLNLRAEQLTVDDFVRLAGEISNFA